jgi:hypothetical protein
MLRHNTCVSIITDLALVYFGLDNKETSINNIVTILNVMMKNINGIEMKLKQIFPSWIKLNLIVTSFIILSFITSFMILSFSFLQFL